MRILLLGANGQIGFELMRAMSVLGEVVPVTRDGLLQGGAPCREVDLASGTALGMLLDGTQPSLIVNAAAYTAVDRAEDEPEIARRVNGDAVGTLGVWAATRGVPVVHFSTDYVFDGSNRRPWREDDATAPLGAYGSSKWLGEQALLASGAQHLILRTAWIYAARGRNFLLSILRAARGEASIRVVDDQYGSPTPARVVADATTAIVARIASRGHFCECVPWGTYHLTTAGQTTWHGFASALLREALRARLIARMPDVQAISSAGWQARARRPTYSVLDCSRIQDAFELRLPSWQEGLTAVISELAGGRPSE